MANWKRFERLVAAIHHAESAGAEVRWNDLVNGRQFDVTVRFKFGLHTYLTVIECKDYSGKVPVEKVEAFTTKSRDVLANKAIMVSSNGFQPGGIEVAAKHGIKLLVLTELVDPTVEHLIRSIVPGLNVKDVRFVLEGSSEEYELEDVGGRLAYLMAHARLVSAAGDSTPNQLVGRWQLSIPSLFVDRENEIELSIPAGTELHVPHEASVRVTAMRFRCNMTDVVIPNQPVMDNHVRAGLTARVELHDAEGKLEHAARLSDLRLGFDKTVEPGRFYGLPSLHNHYYCERIDGGSVHWVLVESYQFGRLIQADLRQDLLYAGYYVEVADERTLRRLRSMLAHYRRPREQS